MRFDELLGNEALKQQLITALDAGRPPHCCLIAGPEGSGKHTLARLLAAALECTDAHPPCGHCSGCRKALAGVHPDILTVDEPKKAQVPVDCIRRAREDAFIRPNEGRRKVFLIPRAQDMNPSAQNALLKILEEPPPYGAFLLLTDAPERLLPTIRSRCRELRLSPLPDGLLRRELHRRFPEKSDREITGVLRRSGGYLGKAAELLRAEKPVLQETVEFAMAYAAHDAVALLKLFLSVEGWKRDRLAPFLLELRGLLTDSLAVRRGADVPSRAARTIAEHRTARELLHGCDALGTALEDCTANVGVANICAGLLIALR